MYNFIFLHSSGVKAARLALAFALGLLLALLTGTQVVRADSGGPDSFGYIYKDSDEPDGPDFDFVDISTSGTSVSLSDDSYGGPFAVGFDFPFYGNPQTEFYIGSNGFLSFGSGSTDLGNDCLLPTSGLIITKSISTIYGTVQLPVLPGSLVTYTIQLAHAGGDAAQSVTMFDVLPAAVRFNEWIEGEEWGTLLLPDTILWGPHDIAADTVVVLRFTAVVTTDKDFYGETIVNVAQYSSDNAGYGSDDASFEIEAAPSAGISFVSPSAGQLFTATNNVSATVPITVATTNFSLPDDGHWQLWVNGNDLGTVYGYTATVTLGLGTRVISAELRDLAHAPLGPVATVTVTVEPRVPLIYLPLVIKDG